MNFKEIFTKKPQCYGVYVSLIIGIAIIVNGFVNGSYHKEFIPEFSFASAGEAEKAAQGHVNALANGFLGKVSYTGSMKPYLVGGEIVVIDSTPFNELKIGEVIVYKAKWTPKNSNLTIHRIVGKDKSGFIMKGDSPKNVTESAINGVANARVTEENYGGKVVGIYRIKP